MTSSTPSSVSGAAILAQFGGASGLIKRLSPLQNVGYRLALILLIMIGIIIVLLGTQWWTHTPPALILPAIDANNADKAIAANNALLQQYKTVNDIAREGPATFFDQIIVKVLFPLLTGVIGYIFGARNAEGLDKPTDTPTDNSGG